MFLLSIIKSQREFIRSITEKKMIVPAIIIGIFGVYSFSITSFLARVALKTNLKNEIFIMLIKDPLISIIYFAISVSVVFLVAGYSKGRIDSLNIRLQVDLEESIRLLYA